MKRQVLLFALFFIFSIGCSENRTVELRNPIEESQVTFTQPASDETAAQGHFDNLKEKFDAQLARFETQIEKAGSTEEKQQIFESQNPLPGYLLDLERLSLHFAETKVGFDAALELVSRSEESGKSDAMKLLIENYSGRLDYRKVIDSLLQDLPNQQIENWLQLLVENAPDDELKARAKLGLARYVDQIPAFRNGFVKNPHLMAKLPEDQQKYLQRERTNEERDLLASMLREVIAEHPDGHYRRGKSYREFAEGSLFELTKLGIGQTAPDIVGRDLDGIEFRLSDYRGKVVMLDFWGHWCGPCRQMYPHEREMVQKLASSPFALIGINSDSELDFVRDAVESEGLSWRHFWNGPQGTLGPIASQWNVEAWPTVYLIDAKGIIRYKEILGEDLDRAIEQLLSEAGHEVSLNP